MKAIVDGEAFDTKSSAASSAQGLAGMLAVVDAAKDFLPDCLATRAHEDIAKDVARRYAKGIDTICALARRGPFGLQPQFHDGKQFSLQTCGGFGAQVFPVFISLGTIPPAIGLANRLVALENAHGDYAWAEHIFKDWDFSGDPIGTLIVGVGPILARTYELALDALMLAFFHEAAHASEGHFSPAADGLNPDETRALESDGDYGAGFFSRHGCSSFPPPWVVALQRRRRKYFSA